jgi:hypothetical protein
VKPSKEAPLKEHRQGKTPNGRSKAEREHQKEILQTLKHENRPPKYEPTPGKPGQKNDEKDSTRPKKRKYK